MKNKYSFKIHLISHTSEPLKAISCAILNLGIGKDIIKLSDITKKEAENAFKDTVKSWLTSPLEYASFNFFVQNVPLFIIREWQRARIGWSYAERSMRFYQLNESIINKIDRRFYDSMDDKQWIAFLEICKSQIKEYLKMRKQGIKTSDCRCVIGVWLPTQLQVSVNYRALRETMAVRLSAQAHSGWQIVAKEIKKLVAEVEPILGNNLVNVCELNQRCVWQSRMDRVCQDCIGKPWTKEPNHVHDFSKGQCSCGEFKPKTKKYGR